MAQDIQSKLKEIQKALESSKRTSARWTALAHIIGAMGYEELLQLIALPQYREEFEGQVQTMVFSAFVSRDGV